MKEFNKNNTWIGLGLQTGGGILAGFEHIDGGIFNLGSLSRNYGFKINSARLGLRAGFSNSLLAVLVFNCSNITKLHGMAYTSDDFTFSVGAKWDTMLRSLKEYKFFTTLTKIMAQGKVVKNWDDLETLTEGIARFLFIGDVKDALTEGKPSFVSLGITGMGLDVGISHSFGGKIEIY